MHKIRSLKILKNDALGEGEPVLLPGLPHHIEITKAQSPGNFKGPALDKFGREIVEAESTADGVVVNSFDDLEPSYAECYEKAIGKKVWMIGPMSLCRRNATQMAARGNKASIDVNRCMGWLDSMKPGSVVYVSFGSLAKTSVSQLIEIGSGLEASNSPFVWAIKAGDDMSEVEKWLSEGFEDRTAGRGLIIRGWAPQLMILSHPAVGGFMTHCGWNSMLESVCAGVPMITWPHFGEQFVNEKLIVQVMGIGVSLGVKLPSAWAMESTAVLAGREDIEKAVKGLMDEGREASAVMRERARELSEKAKSAMQEGGTSYENMKLLVDQIKG